MQLLCICILYYYRSLHCYNILRVEWYACTSCNKFINESDSKEYWYWYHNPLTGCLRYPEVSSSDSTSAVYLCIGGSGTLSTHWTVNGSSHDHIDVHDSNGNYVSEATVSIKLNGMSVQCCMVPAVGYDHICCTTVVNIGIWHRNDYFMITWMNYTMS